MDYININSNLFNYIDYNYEEVIIMIKSLYPCFQHWSEKGSVYLVSDTHFDDPDREYMGYTISNEEQWYLINDICYKNDTLIHLGDVGNLDYIKRLDCYKVLIMGNHDQGKSNFQETCAIIDLDKYTEKEINQMKRHKEIDYWSYEFHAPFVRGYKSNNLFHEVYSGPLWISDKIVLSHEPLTIQTWETAQTVTFNIHGHDHNNTKRDFHLNICQNVYGYIPLNLNQFIKNGELKKINDIHRTIIDNATNNAIAKKLKSYSN